MSKSPSSSITVILGFALILSTLEGPGSIPTRACVTFLATDLKTVPPYFWMSSVASSLSNESSTPVKMKALLSRQKGSPSGIYNDEFYWNENVQWYGLDIKLNIILSLKILIHWEVREKWSLRVVDRIVDSHLLLTLHSGGGSSFLSHTWIPFSLNRQWWIYNSHFPAKITEISRKIRL